MSIENVYRNIGRSIKESTIRKSIVTQKGRIKAWEKLLLISIRGEGGKQGRIIRQTKR